MKIFVVMGLVAGLGLGSAAGAQQEKPEIHGRKYKKLVPAAKITVKVEKATNGKPVTNAGVVFTATTAEGKDEGGLEIKSDQNGNAMLDVIEIGSHVKVQIIADGLATAFTEFDVPTDEKTVVVKMEKPRAQVSTYQDNDGKGSDRNAGVQEPAYLSRPKVVKPKPVSTTPSVLSLPAPAGNVNGPTVPAPILPGTTPETAAPASGAPSNAAPTSPAPPSAAPTTSAPTSSPR